MLDEPFNTKPLQFRQSTTEGGVWHHKTHVALGALPPHPCLSCSSLHDLAKLCGLRMGALQLFFPAALPIVRG